MKLKEKLAYESFIEGQDPTHSTVQYKSGFMAGFDKALEMAIDGATYILPNTNLVGYLKNLGEEEVE